MSTSYCSVAVVLLLMSLASCVVDEFIFCEEWEVSQKTAKVVSIFTRKYLNQTVSE